MNEHNQALRMFVIYEVLSVTDYPYRCHYINPYFDIGFSK